MLEATPRLVRKLTPARRDAGIVGVTFVGQDIERPQIVGPKPAVGHAVSENERTRGAFEGLARLRQVVAQFTGRHAANAAVVVTLAGNLMAALGDLADQLRELIADPAEDEERRLDAVAIEQVERLLGVPFQSRFEAVPLAALNQ